MKSFFSVIIPTLNEESYLPKLLNDLLKQKEKDFEVVVVDANSKDKTKTVVDGFKKKLKIKFYKTQLINVATQRNYGAKRSQGKYLIFIDADARIRPTFIKKSVAYINKFKGLVFIPYLLPEKGDEEYKTLFDIGNLLVEFSQNLSKKFSLGGSMIFERNFFQMIEGFDNKLYISEDHELIQRIFKWGVTPRFMKDNKITVSLRRWKKEGNLKIIYKYFIVTAYRLLGGEVKSKIIEYKMGGSEYEKIKKLDTKKTIFINYKKIFSQIKDTLQSLISED
jgi:glycosyltransferase involved in cell wall biosynthesis